MTQVTKKNFSTKAGFAAKSGRAAGYKGRGRPLGQRKNRPQPSEPILIAFNKPYQVLTQFTDQQGRATLKQFIKVPDVYAAGRLDYNSEGLLLLTNSGSLQARIAAPHHNIAKTYWVQVEGDVSQDQINQLRYGVLLNDGPTKPAGVRLIKEPKSLWPRNPPIRWRANIPTHWLEITITEGRNRQVRRMTAAVGLPTLRLIRIQIGKWKLGQLTPGRWKHVPL